jgi:hypothetical protein
MSPVAGSMAVGGWGGHGSTDLVLPIGGGLVEPLRRGGAQHARRPCWQGRELGLTASGEATALHPRRELDTTISLDRVGSGRLVLHRGIAGKRPGGRQQRQGPHPQPSPAPCSAALRHGRLYSCSGPAASASPMPGLALLGPGSPVLVAGALAGQVAPAAATSQPAPPGQRPCPQPGAVAALAVRLQDLQPQWLRACFFEGHGSALLVAIAAPVPCSTWRWLARPPSPTAPWRRRCSISRFRAASAPAWPRALRPAVGGPDPGGWPVGALRAGPQPALGGIDRPGARRQPAGGPLPHPPAPDAPLQPPIPGAPGGLRPARLPRGDHQQSGIRPAGPRKTAIQSRLPPFRPDPWPTRPPCRPTTISSSVRRARPWSRPALAVSPLAITQVIRIPRRCSARTSRRQLVRLKVARRCW